MQAASANLTPQRMLFPWLSSPHTRRVFYIGSALAGWLYVALILYAILTVPNPLTGPLAPLKLGPWHVPLTLHLMVVLSWAWILDAPHVWATLARTLFD